MKLQIISALFIVLFFCFCKTPEGIDNPQNTIARELNPAKSFYTSKGAGFKFRVYQYPPIEGDTNNYNFHSAEVYKIIDNQGVYSVISKFSVPIINMISYGAILNCQGDFNTPESTNKIVFQSQSAYDDFEIDTDNTRLISYNSSSGAHGSYGFAGTRIYIHNPTPFSGAISASSNQGYMHTINHANFMLSMGYNSNYGHPMLYRYNPADYSWSGEVVTKMDFVSGSNINIPMTNDASKAGNSDRVFWVWLSYTTNLSNGKINIISYNGSAFSEVTSLDGIGSIGTGWNSVNTIMIYKNPANLNNPYIIVKHYNSDILDIYKFNGSAIETVKKGVTLPSTLPLVPGNTIRSYKDIVFSGNNIYLISGNDKNLYQLVDNSFEICMPDLTVTDERISALESTPNGILTSIVKIIPSKPMTKIVSDIVFIPNK